MSERMTDEELLDHLDAASRDERLSDGMLYRHAAKRIAERMLLTASYWHKIMRRTDLQAEEIQRLEAKLAAVEKYAKSLGWNPNDGQKTSADTEAERVKNTLIKIINRESGDE